MSCFTKEQLLNAYLKMINSVSPDDVAWYFSPGRGDGMAVMNDREVIKSTLNISGQASRGEVQVLECNNKSAKTFDGRKWHFLVIQVLEDGKLSEEHSSFDMAGMFLLGEMVSGTLIAFQHKKTRDFMFKRISRSMIARDEEE